MWCSLLNSLVWNPKESSPLISNPNSTRYFSFVTFYDCDALFKIACFQDVFARISVSVSCFFMLSWLKCARWRLYLTMLFLGHIYRFQCEDNSELRVGECAKGSSHPQFSNTIPLFMDRDSSVGITTGYGLDSPEIEFRWGRDFSHTSTPALGHTQPPPQWVPGLSRG
jgi:hypothetical protein